jgi:hypothetical protein
MLLQRTVRLPHPRDSSGRRRTRLADGVRLEEGDHRVKSLGFHGRERSDEESAVRFRDQKPVAFELG